VQGYLLKICIPCSGSACAWDCPELQVEADGGRRRLLASAATDEFSCQQAAETCSPGSEPFWSQLAMIQAGRCWMTRGWGGVVQVCRPRGRCG
jgi:hypothetical protein